MECKHPPPLSDEMLNAALDGLAPQGVLDHLAQCPACAARLARMHTAERILADTFSRWDCVDALLLADYQLGLLAVGEADAIAQHLRSCPRCTAEIADLRGVLVDDHDLASTTRLEHTLPRMPMTMVAHLLSGSPGASAMALRGEGNGPLIFQAADATIILEPRWTPPNLVHLIGQIADATHPGRWLNARVEAWQDDAVVAVGFVDAIGAFSLGAFLRRETTLLLIALEGDAVSVIYPLS